MSGKVKFGAVEVLSQNGDTLIYNGYQPSYPQLTSYNHLIAPATGKLINRGNLSLSNVIRLIESIIREYHYQVRPLAKHLYHKDLGQACFNIWHFIKTNIRYDFDRPGLEEVRTPARVWADRNSQNDCEDYSILAAALLIEMGYNPVCKIVSFSGPDRFQHIYVKCGVYTIDGVLNEFNVEPKNITDYMQTNQLGSVGNSSTITTIAGVQSMDPHTKKLVDIQNKLVAHIQAYGHSEERDAALRKVRALIEMAGSPEQEILGEVMHLVDDIDAKGNLIFSSTERANAFAGHYNQILQDNQELEALYGIDQRELCGMDYEAENDLRDGIKQELAMQMGGIGAEEYDLGKKAKAQKAADRAKKKADNNAKKATKDAKKAEKKQARKQKQANKKPSKLKTAVKKAGSAVSKGVKKVVKSVQKVNPLFVAARNAYLALVQLNYRGIATRLSVGLAPLAEAKRMGYSDAEHANAVRVIKEVDEKWAKTFGGDVSKLHGAINRGKTKGKKGKAAFKATSAANAVAKKSAPKPTPTKGKKPVLIKVGGKIHGVDAWDDLEGVSGLGEPATVAMITAASTILAAFAKLVSSIKARGANGEEIDIEGEGFESTGNQDIDAAIKAANAVSNTLNPAEQLPAVSDDVPAEEAGFQNEAAKAVVKNAVNKQPGSTINTSVSDDPEVPEGGMSVDKLADGSDTSSGDSGSEDGMSTGTKVAIGIGVATVVAGGIYLGTKGSKPKRRGGR